ncbi:hypothetical protein [Brevundimonas aurifodinae]|uniref:Uncharacterized protein n=2 Tax=Brevundimonas TaxID=41275 RepID=A0ABV1NKJ7_9CAUL|nr:MAG: hypothetical protein B7Z42_08585 [Brevundimonas sp. 12-68-7]OYX29697.1 MAG: hypothetical protein B7Z01_15420 [Brevundimonas subvibrioides]
MKRSITLTSALALTLAISGAAMAQNGNGNGNGRGSGGGESAQQDRGNGNGGGNVNRSGGNDNRRGDNGRGNDRAERQADLRIPDVARDVARGQDRIERDVRREVEQRVGLDDGVVVLRRDAGRGLLNGCPPGLAKRDNGCLPPGQVRQIERAQDPYNRYNYLWRTLGGDGEYRYRDGYVYRTTPQGGLLGYLPVLGGILSPGNAWPAQYQYQQPPRYLSQYYGLNDGTQYRYADGVLYRVDPQTSSIGQVAALLTGQQFNVGQRLPAGYDVYNVPSAYRNQYPDSAQSQYRYNDGYVYQVDPTTQLVQAVIQLLT